MIPMHGRKAIAIVSLTMAVVMASACGRSRNTLAPSGPTPVGGTLKVAIEGQVNLSVGQTIQLFAFVTRADGTKEDVTGQAMWSADAPDVATVNGGLVRGVKSGVARILATYESTTGVFAVTVVSSPLTPPPTAGPNPGDPDGSEPPEGPSPGPGPTPPSPPPPSPPPPGPTPPGPTPPGPTPPSPTPPGPTPPGPTPPAPTPPPPSGPTVTAVTVTGAVNVSPGASTQLTAIATMSDGARVDVTGSATWASSQPSILSISAQGRVTGLGAGLCSVTATFKGITARVEIQVTGAPVIESLRIVGGAQLRVGHGLQLRAIVRYSDGSEKDVTDLVDWSCSNSLLASITKGLLHGHGPGTVNIVARYQGHSALLGVLVTL